MWRTGRLTASGVVLSIAAAAPSSHTCASGDDMYMCASLSLHAPAVSSHPSHADCSFQENNAMAADVATQTSLSLALGAVMRLDRDLNKPYLISTAGFRVMVRWKKQEVDDRVGRRRGHAVTTHIHEAIVTATAYPEFTFVAGLKRHRQPPERICSGPGGRVIQATTPVAGVIQHSVRFYRFNEAWNGAATVWTYGGLFYTLHSWMPPHANESAKQQREKRLLFLVNDLRRAKPLTGHAAMVEGLRTSDSVHYS